MASVEHDLPPGPVGLRCWRLRIADTPPDKSGMPIDAMTRPRDHRAQLKHLEALVAQKYPEPSKAFVSTESKTQKQAKVTRPGRMRTSSL